MSSQALAFNGNRKGFILDGGMGAGWVSVDLRDFIGHKENKVAVTTDINIGLATSNRVGFFLCNKLSWFGLSQGPERKLYSSGLHALSFRYYDREEQTAYPTVGIGLATLSTPFSNDPHIWTGWGALIGVWLEYGRHTTLELNLIYSSVSYYGLTIDCLAARGVLLFSAF